MSEISWLHEHGLVSSFEDYESMRLSVLEDARLIMRAERIRDSKEAHLAGSR